MNGIIITAVRILCILYDASRLSKYSVKPKTEILKVRDRAEIRTTDLGIGDLTESPFCSRLKMRYRIQSAYKSLYYKYLLDLFPVEFW